MKIVLYFTQFKLNKAIDTIKVKLDTQFMELVLKYTKKKQAKLSHE